MIKTPVKRIGGIVCDADGVTVADCRHAGSFAIEIALALNTREELMAACEAAHTLLGVYRGRGVIGDADFWELDRKLTAAIRAARGEA